MWIEHRYKDSFLRIFHRNVIVGEGFESKTIELLTTIVIASRNTGGKVALACGNPEHVAILVKKHLGIELRLDRDRVVSVIDGEECGVHDIVFHPFRHYAYVSIPEGDRVVVGIAYRP